MGNALTQWRKVIWLLLAVIALSFVSYYTAGIVGEILRVSYASDAPEILSYYSAAQGRYFSIHKRYATVNQLLDEKHLYLGANNNIPWGEEMTTRGHHFVFSLGPDARTFSAGAKPVGMIAERLKELRINSPSSSDPQGGESANTSFQQPGQTAARR